MLMAAIIECRRFLPRVRDADITTVSFAIAASMRSSC